MAALQRASHRVVTTRVEVLTFSVGVVCLIVLIGYAWSVSIGRLTHGFVAYHTAAQLLLEGRMGPEIYDDAWFRADLQRRTSSSVLEIFGPNPPTMALLALPVAVLDPAAARSVWLLLSLVALAVTAFSLARDARHAVLLPAAAAVLLTSPAVFANLRTGQAYLVLGLLYAGAALLLARRRDFAGGACLGLTIALKTAGIPWLLVLMMARRWQALGAAIGTAVAIGVAALPWTGLAAWRAYPAAVTEFVARPTTGVTAHQTTVGFVRHWCPAEGYFLGAACPAIATIVPLGVVALAALITAVAARDAPPRLASAVGACVSILCQPIAEDHQFVMLAAPLFALLATPPRWAWLGVALLFVVPARLTSERFPDGWLSLLAYPRLYATWLLWALLIDAIRRTPGTAGFSDEQRRQQSARLTAPAT